MNSEFREILLETIREVQEHPDGAEGIGFVMNFDEEPEWEVALIFRPKDKENVVTH